MAKCEYVAIPITTNVDDVGNELSERVTHRTDLLAFSEIDGPWGGGLSCVGSGRISSTCMRTIGARGKNGANWSLVERH